MEQFHLDREEILLLAKASALQLSEELIQEYQTSLSAVITSMKEALAIEIDDADSCESLFMHVVNVEDLREDSVTSDFNREEFLRNVPESLGGLVKVPAVIK
ncbi:glutamyl-tRNA (Gln) amidotransferase subunit C [Chlamydia pneumoniae TW-183]|uniref:Glutamyl-tRNA(Gln) amidotransferase subunit C n=2 Tax=Chlamydia pneumoniae TaxID=83558 RepID=GATC_CHLPN|nr:Asp-tRNA(Asn)/Glu-tRNA(Gln) amidotransferase subunit GatC [Chlamydia pneumoniae]Q9Z9G8.1 RecName: Full=Glutamyl-tRNA(Gln) amidotransferase subunit C; Short=Glu-ADT subunit C [Chlamydia pneumoniae]AAD18160.1 Glu-tRNA Gln Amidotransferase (C subunit) [Chlamydia pneumoniae CWL029]AAF73703.1 glutamyl-tRNA(Gln) amidotransferase subunit C, putative [Chlamydia pneumoniae AR39]AAP97936.1 glutamyl-tRNA (Gln) amidotransferase subunit C [Chlamydia pneumoniae TW-183]ACZ32978.1 glutamyl-tRNA(Gln) amidot